MPEFLELLPPPEALKRWMAHLPEPLPETEELDTFKALGRVTTREITSPEALPAFPRSTVDGFAVVARDTFGASDALPAYLTLAGEVPMGRQPDFNLHPTQAALIYTGGMLPEGADAVVMLEYTQQAKPNEIEILRASASGENILKTGEDVAAGQVVVPAGVRLRPPEIGGLLALGITRVNVTRRPRIGIISSGDEIVAPQEKPSAGQVRDVNSYSLGALVEQAGGIPVLYGIILDKREALQQTLQTALDECAAIIVTAGSSASTRDLTAEVIQNLGDPGVLVHGVNLRPGKPTILAVCNGKAVVGLPGNPVSALVVAGIFATPLVERLLGLANPRPRPALIARLTINLASQAGREDYVPVTLIAGPQGYLAEPIFYKSNLIFTLARADGLVKISSAATGLSAGDQVTVTLL
jgi:molybdopterin molybdotransferase